MRVAKRASSTAEKVKYSHHSRSGGSRAEAAGARDRDIDPSKVYVYRKNHSAQERKQGVAAESSTGIIMWLIEALSGAITRAISARVCRSV